MPISLDRPVDDFVPSEVGNTSDAEGRYSSAVLDVTVIGVNRDGDGSIPALKAAARAPGGAAAFVEVENDVLFSLWKDEVSLFLMVNESMEWTCPFLFSLAAMDF